MPIALTDKIVALLVALTPADIEALPPAERRRLADQCRHVAGLAERQNTVPKAGLLRQWADGERAD
jgi:hypothetical protein